VRTAASSWKAATSGRPFSRTRTSSFSRRFAGSARRAPPARVARKGRGLELEKVLADVRERDRRDREREMSPLVRGADAVVVDNTAMDGEETARVIVLCAQEKAKRSVTSDW